MKYDSEKDTRKHIAIVGKYLLGVINRITFRIIDHDEVKLSKKEKSVFDNYTPKLAKSTYGSKKYKKFLSAMKPALEHHYKYSKHHPEHYKNGIKGMNLIDIIEMLCDWKAATLRHNDGDIFKSIELNQKRFGYSDDLKNILVNTANYLCM